MTTLTTYLTPALGQVPGSVSLPMLARLVRSLPLPDPGGPADAAQQLIEDALAAVDAAGPRDRWEAQLVVRQVALGAQADALMVRAMTEAEPERQERTQKLMLALQRRAEALGRELRQHRRALAAEGMVHVAPPPQTVDVAALAAFRQAPEQGLGAEVLTPQTIDPATFWPKAEAAAEAPVLESREDFEAPPLPVFRGVPLWKQHGRRWLDELTDAELDEVVRAQMRGEVIEEAPVRPEGVPYPAKEQWRREGNWLSDAAIAAR